MASSARIEELRKKFEENPRRYFAPLANEYRKAGDIEQAIAICREYLPQQPGHMSGHIVYGQALYEARQVEEAKTVFETALSLDPENLIALRHLGDIALMVGDSQAARMWYGRVLEADPRNEEIQAQLASIDQVTSSAPTPIANVAIPEYAPPPVQPAKPTPSSSAPTVVVSAQPRQPWAKKVETPRAPAEPVPPARDQDKASTPDVPTSLSKAPTLEVNTDALPQAPPTPSRDLGATQPIDLGATVPIATTALGFEPTSMGPPPESERPASSPQDAPPLDSFSLEGLETTSLAAPPPAPTPSPEEPVAPPSPAPTPTADASAEPAAAAEPALVDLDLGAPVAADETPAAVAPAASTDDLPLLDIGDLPSTPADVAPALAEAATPPAPPEPRQHGTPLAVRAIDEFTPVAPPEPVPDESAAPPESGPFVTETMAELYLKQGHREEALRVYRALLDQRPDDASLAAKVAALAPKPAPSVHSGPTIRQLLSGIASRRPGAQRVAATNGAASEPAPPPAQTSHGRQLNDALGLLFGAAQVSAADESAAMALAVAFADRNGLEGGEAAVIGGAPARHASNDLSLDAVFKSEKAPSAAPSSFSFDQFFSQRATSEHSTHSGGPAASPAESRDDVAQFTQWLEGLKQR